ncbi:ABC transporter ATP-binding protein [Oceanisphaera sp. IT1-181]|uniref:ABC transporter ATP-binding protein n=1 Tax=Oceanisphaera sp. IT1-181 TaxID=3081199 RepID=UPI0029CA8202|nr:ABC transporter ATP-binding protein [Oceanisphaera sp. IT1-181]
MLSKTLTVADATDAKTEPMAHLEVAIAVRNITKCYEMYDKPHQRLKQLFAGKKRRYYKEFWALKGISFDVKKGETLGIMGRNGSGKSTLLQIIAGTLTPTAGDVKVNGRLAALLELGAGFNPEFSGRDNVYLNGAILGFTHTEMQAKFADIEAFADIGEHIDQPVKTYSSGMYVRLAFAVQACVEPQVLIVDEALSVGDEKFQRKCFDYIDALRQKGCAILIVTHSTATVEKFCQRAVLLHKGEMHGMGPAKEMVDQYHALLYSDEQTYLRYLNTAASQAHSVVDQVSENKDDEIIVAENVSTEPQGGARAIISGWQVTDGQGKACEVFRSGDVARIHFDIDVMANISELQAGLLVRTVEGVPVFGTSTLYHQLNYLEPKQGQQLQASFELDLMLCEGTYFVTLAIAEAISHADMAYLDRKTDIIILKVSEPRAVSHGIASLPTKVNLQLKE